MYLLGWEHRRTLCTKYESGQRAVSHKANLHVFEDHYAFYISIYAIVPKKSNCFG